MSLQPKSKRLVTEEKLDESINSTVLDPEGELQTSLKSTYGEPKADKAKEVRGAQFLAPVRVPVLVVDEEFPQFGNDFLPIWADGNTIYAYNAPVSTGPQLSKSTDGGRTWARRGYPPTAMSRVRFYKLMDGTLLMGDSNNPCTFYRSTDDGSTWQPVLTLRKDEEFLGVQSWAQDKSTGYIYFAVYYTSYNGKGTSVWPDVRLYRSIDQGATWSVFLTFPSAHDTTNPGRISHFHAVQWDHVSERIFISAGDTEEAAGIYRVNASGTGIEPVVLNSQMPGDSARPIGLMFFPDYIAWNADTGDGGLWRLSRGQFGVNAAPERVFTMNSSGYYTIRAANDGSRWLCSATSLNGIDNLVHLYSVEDNGATVYEVAAFAQDAAPGVQASIAPLGQPDQSGDTVWLTNSNFGSGWVIKGRVGLGAVGVRTPPRPYVAPPIPHVPQSPTTGEMSLPVWLAAADVPMPKRDFRAFGFIANRSETITKVLMTTGATPAAAATLVRVGIYRVLPNQTLSLVASSGNALDVFKAPFTQFTINLSAPWSKVAWMPYCVGLFYDGDIAPSFIGWRTAGARPPGHDVQTPMFAIAVAGAGSQTDLPANGTTIIGGAGGPAAYVIP